MAKKNKSRNVRTWTFQPAPDVEKMVTEYFGGVSTKGDKTKLFNEAMRHQLPGAALAVAEQEFAAKGTQVKQLRERLNHREARKSTGDGLPILEAAKNQAQELPEVQKP